MTATVYSGMLTPVSATASTAASGYAAANALIPGVNRGWKSTGTGSQWITVDLGASLAVVGVALQAIDGANIGVSVYADNAAAPTTYRGVMSIGSDANARSKGIFAFSATVRYIRCYVAGSSTVGVGSIFVFTAATNLNRGPLYGQTTITPITPQVSNELPNGIIETYATGSATTEISMGFGPAPTDDLDAVRRAARAGPCWLDFGLSNQRDRQWPVRHVEDKSPRKIDRYNRESQSLTFREIT